MVFSVCTVLLDSKEVKFGSSDQDASPSAGKITKVVLCHVVHESVSLQLLLVV